MDGRSPAEETVQITVFILQAQSHVGARALQNDHEWSELVEVDVPRSSVPGRHGSYCVASRDVLEAIQTGPGRIDGPANIYFSLGLNRQRIFTMDGSGDINPTDTSILPLTYDLSLSLEVEPLPPNRLLTRRNSLDLTPEEEVEYWRSYDFMEKSLATLGPNPDIPTWSPKDWAEVGVVMSRLTMFERVQLQARVYQEDRHPPYDSEPPAEYDIETALPKPYRPPRPWEKGNDPPEWIKEAPIKKSVQDMEWDPSYAPIHPSYDYIFGEKDFDIPDNSGYSRSEINEAITQYLQSVLKGYPVYNHILSWKNITLPLMDVLRLYYFVKKRIEEFAGLRVPRVVPVCGGHLITKENVLAALERRPSWGSDCLETLELAEKYGPLGPNEHPTIVEALNSSSKNSMGSVSFLKLLRSIDREAQ